MVFIHNREIMLPEKIIVDVINLKVSVGDLDKEFKNQRKIQQKVHPENIKASRCYRYKPRGVRHYNKNKALREKSMKNKVGITSGDSPSSSTNGGKIELKSYKQLDDTRMYRGIETESGDR